MNTVEILKSARELLVTKGWTQGDYAKDAEGNSAPVRPDQAACFCGHGALYAIAGGFGRAYAAEKAVDAAAGEYFPDFNDAPGRTVDEVLAVFDKAIAAEEARG